MHGVSDQGKPYVGRSNPAFRRTDRDDRGPDNSNDTSMSEFAERAATFDTSAATPSRPEVIVENPLSNYLEKGFHEIAGWLWMPAVEATLTLAAIQATRVPAGPVCEIGVWEGRYLSLLSFLPATPHRVLAIDPLIHGGNREAQLTRLLGNIARYARRPDLVTLLEEDSKTVTAETIRTTLGAPCQFVSADGDRTMEGAMHDLHLAEAITAPGGIVALDDIPNFSCPGVTEAIVRHALDASHTLAPFLLVSNKLFLTQKAFCEEYRREDCCAS